MFNTYTEKEYSLDQLENHIHRLRKKLIDVGMREGFNNPATIQVSQQLDHFIFQYQQYKKVI